MLIDLPWTLCPSLGQSLCRGGTSYNLVCVALPSPARGQGVWGLSLAGSSTSGMEGMISPKRVLCEKMGIVVRMGCPDRTPHTGWRKQQTFMPHHSGDWKPKIRVPADWLPGDSCPPAPRGPLPASRTAGGGRELRGLCLFHQDNSPTAQSPHPGPSLNLLTSSWALSPCTGTWGSICPHTKQEDTNIRSLVMTEEKASGRRCDHRNYSTWIFIDNTRSTKEQDEIGYASDLSVHLHKRT